MTKKADTLDVPFDVSDDAIERRWRDVAQLHRLGVRMKSAKFRTGKKAGAERSSSRSQPTSKTE